MCAAVRAADQVIPPPASAARLVRGSSSYGTPVRQLHLLLCQSQGLHNSPLNYFAVPLPPIPEHAGPGNVVAEAVRREAIRLSGLLNRIALEAALEPKVDD